MHKTAGDLAGKTTATAESMTAAADESAADAKDRAAAMGTSTGSAVVSFVNDNALLVAGIGAAVGAFIAASIPSSDAENRLFGAGSEKLKDKAREAAAQGIERPATSPPKRRARLPRPPPARAWMPPAIQRALNTVADSVRKVADRGLETALGYDSEASQQPTTERNAT